jgi:signal transduction histidine kinase
VGEIVTAALEGALSRIVSAALARSDLSVLRDMLLLVAREVNAHGCALWQVQPSGRFRRDNSGDPASLPLDSRIFVLADGAPEGLVCAYHDVPWTSATATAIREGRVNIPDISKDDRVNKTGDFLLRAGIQSMCSVRVMIDEQTPGALTVYRRELGEFSEVELSLLEFMAAHIPMLYRTVRDRVSFRLIHDVEANIHEAEIHPIFSQQNLESLMGSLCQALADGFQCLEATIYLENPLEEAGNLWLMGTTCKEFIRKAQYAPNDHGLTPWVWTKKTPITVFDVKTFDQSEYPGLDWRDEADVKEMTRRLLDLAPEAELPPISFMAVPVAMGDSVFGVLRCCAARRGPYYFAEREVKLLGMIAARIGQFWSSAIRHQEMSNELESWKALTRGISSLNLAMQDSLTGVASDHGDILGKALDVIREAVPIVSILSAGLLDLESRKLTVRAYRGDAWVEGGEAAIEARRQALACSIDENPLRSPSAIAFRTRRLLDLSDEQFVPMFPGVKRALFSPILGDSECLGVLTVQCAGRVKLPLQTSAMLELVSQQIGLYLQLAVGVSQLTATYQDFQHQLRSPVFQAYKRMLQIKGVDGNYNLEAVKGLLGKAKRVVTNLRLYANLTAGKPIDSNLDLVIFSDLVKNLIEAASDNQVLWRHRRIAFTVAKETFDTRSIIAVDLDLFGQAVNNILDNAGKYSFENTEINIAGRPNMMGFVAISFRNKGEPMTEADTKLAPKRGWRGAAAEKCAGEGSGIGLWIVDHVMRAHRGRLEIIPTGAQKDTEIRLIFPARSGGRD